MARQKRDKKVELDAQADGFAHNPFAALQQKREELPAGQTTAAAEQAASPQQGEAWDLSASPKLVLRSETKGRGGRVVTLIEGVVGSQEQRKQLARELGKKLGCGGNVDGEALLIQGDQRERLEELLRARGAKKIVGL